MSIENITPHTRIALVYNWPDGKLDKPMRSCKIYFSHPVKIQSVYRNDGNSSKLGDVQLTHEGQKVTIQLLNAEVPVVGNPFNDIKIEFTTIHPYVKMNDFIWYVQKDAIGPKKIAPPKELKNFNDYFHKAPPPPPVINEPRDGASSWNREPKIKGKAEADSTVAVFVDGVKVGTTRSSEAGVWVFPITIPLDPRKNKFKFTAKLIYSDGEESEESTPIYYTVTS